VERVDAVRTEQYRDERDTAQYFCFEGREH
jgi:hypothetical protein